ncbi:MAG: DNA polymerase III subunit delta [Candidatus Kapabacteria bacterium]|nr:DNA polymerase III subunit delta [Candidatus Kapabacteria bacterium]
MINIIDELIKNEKYPPVLLVFGEEEFLIEETLNRIKTKFQINDENSFDFEVLDGEKTSYKEIVEKCLTFPFVSKTRTVVVNNFESLTEISKSKKEKINIPFKNYLENPQNSTFLVLISKDSSINNKSSAKNSQKAPKKGKSQSTLKFPYDLIFERHKTIEFKKFKDNDYISWIQKKVEANNKKISPVAAQIFFTSLNPNLRDIDNELDKLLLFEKNKNIIDEEDITQLIGQSRKFNVFELQKAIGNRDINLSLEILTNLLKNERQEMLIMTIIAKYFITLWKLYDLKHSNLTSAEIGAMVGVNPYFIKEYQNALNKYQIEEIERAIVLFNEIDEKLKSTSIDSLYLMQSLLIRIMEKN